MSWRGESKAIREALAKENRVFRPRCLLCGVRPAVVHVKQYMICYQCAQEYIRRYGPGVSGEEVINSCTAIISDKAIIEVREFKQCELFQQDVHG